MNEINIPGTVATPALAGREIFNTGDAIAHRVTDGFDNFVSRLGLNNDNALSAGIYTFNLLTNNRIQLEAAYRGSWVVGVIVDAIAEDMTRAGVDITTNEATVDMKDLHTAISRLQIWTSLASTIKWSRLYGGALAVLQIEGQKMDTPLDVSTISKGQFKGLVVYDRWQLNPDLTRLIPNGPEIGKPKFYAVVNNPVQDFDDDEDEEYGQDASGQIRIHHSRCIRLDGIELPYFQAITNMMWGESVLERLWDRLIAFDNATMSSASLIDRANLRTVNIENLREILSQGGQAQKGLESMFEMMRLMQVNEGMTLLDGNDKFQSTAYTFAGLADMLIQFGQQLSGGSGVPLVRMFGQSPAGLSATGEADLRMYYDNINAQQNAKLSRAWDLLLKVLFRSVFEQDAPKDLEFTFTALWQTSDTEKATIAKTNAETITGVHEAGLVTTKTAMEELRGLSSTTGLFSNISDEEIAELEAEEPPVPEVAIDPTDPTAAPKKPDLSLVKSFDKKPGAMRRIKAWLRAG